MNREIKFRAWDKENKKMIYWNEVNPEKNYALTIWGNPFSYSQGRAPFTHWYENIELMQYTGLKDKNGLQEVYEGDIIDEYGNIKGNIYQMDKGETDILIQGFGTKDWCETYRRAILCGCKDSQ